MRVRGRRRKSVVFFITLGVCLVALAVALNVGWIILNWREVALLVLGIVFFIVLIFGLVLNTTFLIREIRRNEQHDAFINAVTHELKTPIASIRLYLETLQTRDVGEEERREFYDIMLADSGRLLSHARRYLRAGFRRFPPQPRHSSGHENHQQPEKRISRAGKWMFLSGPHARIKHKCGQFPKN